MLVLEPLRGLRVVADPAAVDAARWQGDAADLVVLRLAPDDAFGLFARAVDIADDHAIVEEEHGFVGARLTPEALELVRSRTEWPLPSARPALAQGLVAGVPARLWLPAEGQALLLTGVAHAAELAERLG